METSNIRKRMPVSALLDPKIAIPAIEFAFFKLDPRTLIKNPVMFVVEVVTVLTTIIFVRDIATGGGQFRLHVPNYRVAVVHGVFCKLC